MKEREKERKKSIGLAKIGCHVRDRSGSHRNDRASHRQQVSPLFRCPEDDDETLDRRRKSVRVLSITSIRRT